MKVLGLERGERGSQARHTEIKEFYAAITKEHQLRIDPERLPDPPVFRTKKAMKDYKKEVMKAVNEQVREPLKVVFHQAMLTREEAAKCEALEKLAAERVAQAEKNAERAMQMLDEAGRENEALSLQNDYLSRES